MTVADVQAPLNLDADESYALHVKADGTATISAATVWGALHGLETLSQLVSYDFFAQSYSIAGLPIQISDVPRFKHRGLLIDSGRHFESVKQVKRFINSMAHAKLNVLHWHLTEDQSFPIASRKFPDLPQKGSWSSQEQYTSQEIASIVEFARLRGVRVMPEFDMPGHSSSWRNSHPEFFATACLDPNSRGAFDPALPETFGFLETQLEDWTTGMFSDDFLHLGSDEVPSGCWNNSRDLAFMKQKGFNSTDDLFNYFVNEMANIAKKMGKTAVFWDEAFLSAKPPLDAIIQNWHDADLFQKILNAGYRGIFSSAGGYTNGWYFDALGVSWQKMYLLDPQTNITDDKVHLIVGGEGCMWGETVDPSDLEATVWPRAAAIAERLWSPRSVNDVDQALPRLEAFRCLLLSRGHSAGVIGGSGRQSPPGPGSCSQLISSAGDIVV